VSLVTASRSISAFVAEETRIRAAYAARHDNWRYSWLNPAHVYLAQEQHRAVLEVLRSEGYETLAAARILDVGCGSGQLLRQFIDWGASPGNLTGIDLLSHRVAEAIRTLPPAACVREGNAVDLGGPDAQFDIVLQFTVFSSILDRDLRRAVAAEMARVVKPSGVIIWYDLNTRNPSNPDVRPIGRTEINELFPHCDISWRRITLAPPLVRLLAPRARFLCDLLNTLPVLRTHCLAAIRPKAPPC
jgi:ubiquinone/menaquinone biosynthesis C-methylase UbiE